MASPSSIPYHLFDVLTILVLGFVYVIALSLGTVVSYAYRMLDTVKSSCMGVLQRFAGNPAR